MADLKNANLELKQKVDTHKKRFRLHMEAQVRNQNNAWELLLFFPAARETASREVLTRHVETEMTCCCVEMINNTQLFNLKPHYVVFHFWRPLQVFRYLGIDFSVVNTQ